MEDCRREGKHRYVISSQCPFSAEHVYCRHRETVSRLQANMRSRSSGAGRAVAMRGPFRTCDQHQSSSARKLSKKLWLISNLCKAHVVALTKQLCCTYNQQQGNMYSTKRQRVQAPPIVPAEAYAPCTSGSAEWQTLLAKDLPAPVLSDIVADLLTDPASQQLAQAAVARCRMNHGCTLKKQVQQLVAETVKEPDENLCMKMGRLAGSTTDLEHLVDKAQRWVQQQGYEAAFELIWQCTSMASDWEERGNDGDEWDDWDQAADKVMLSTLDYMETAGVQKSWTDN